MTARKFWGKHLLAMAGTFLVMVLFLALFAGKNGIAFTDAAGEVVDEGWLQLFRLDLPLYLLGAAWVTSPATAMEHGLKYMPLMLGLGVTRRRAFGGVIACHSLGMLASGAVITAVVFGLSTGVAVAALPVLYMILLTLAGGGCLLSTALQRSVVLGIVVAVVELVAYFGLVLFLLIYMYEELPVLGAVWIGLGCALYAVHILLGWLVIRRMEVKE